MPFLKDRMGHIGGICYSGLFGNIGTEYVILVFLRSLQWTKPGSRVKIFESRVLGGAGHF